MIQLHHHRNAQPEFFAQFRQMLWLDALFENRAMQA
jgi:hypothetical protein